MSKPRTGIPDAPGLGKVTNASEWGERTATERYGYGTQTFSPPKDVQAPQDPVDKHSPNYDNDASGWLRAEGETAEHRPNFMPGYRAKNGEPGTRGGSKLRPGDVGPHSTEPPTRPYRPTVPAALRDRGREMGRHGDD